VDLGLRSRCSDLTTDYTIGDSDSGKDERLYPDRPHRFWSPHSLLFNGYGGSFPGGGSVKLPGRDIDYLPSGTEVRYKWMCTPAPHMCFRGVGTERALAYYRSVDGVPVMNGEREQVDRVLQSLVSAFTYTVIERLDLERHGGKDYLRCSGTENL
jgi:hypothetical protein